MTNRGISIRSLAKQLGLSKTVVSDALNCRDSVSPATARKVRAAAEEAGYRPNPLASTVMSLMKRNDRSSLRGTLALVSVHEPQRPPGAAIFNSGLFEGARQRALSLGFQLQVFNLGQGDLTPQRLQQILEWRGIRGVLLLPVWDTPSIADFDWSKFAVVYMDYPVGEPRFHAVCDGNRAPRRSGAVREVRRRDRRRLQPEVLRRGERQLRDRVTDRQRDAARAWSRACRPSVRGR